ncbi:hypothetical protein [Caulobacter sp. 17J80-11]|uniref:hypothetical protein n=1 Tax=Caulobacter sp. 17J80-11 TaxID=2763502 RepID=UPI0016538BC2|nr:hypothetical protein [Caulobacter sp. 17J80-11]MBC6980296.1 hypothetical protein [Caulobacter sp. 17J80-11]
MRKMTVKPTRRTWILIFGLLAAVAVGAWVLKQGAAKRAAAHRPAVALSAGAEQARGALKTRVGRDVDLLYVTEPGAGVVCGYYGRKAEKPGQPVRAASFVFQNGQVVLGADKGAEWNAFQKAACGAGWTAQP